MEMRPTIFSWSSPTGKWRMRRFIMEPRASSRLVSGRQQTTSEVMTSEVVCCRPETSLEEARGSMMNRRIRHLPVGDDQENMVGLISIGDLNAQERTSP